MDLLEKTFQLGQVIIINIARKNRIIGDFTLLMPHGKKLEKSELAILYANQVGLLMDREKAVQELQKERDLFVSGPVFTIAWNPV